MGRNERRKLIVGNTLINEISFKIIILFHIANVLLKFYPAPSRPSLTSFRRGTTHGIFAGGMDVMGWSRCSTVLAGVSTQTMSVAVVMGILFGLLRG
jgi:hypothetical protein